jgi:hypothetical protein
VETLEGETGRKEACESGMRCLDDSKVILLQRNYDVV